MLSAQSSSGDRMRVALRIVLGALAVVGLAQSVPALAQSDDERARTHFEAGRSYYEQAQYDDAVREFQESFDLSGRPELLLNVSQAQERALNYDAAIAAAQRYLTLVPNADNRKTVEERIASLRELKQRYEEGGPAPLAPPGSSSELAPMPAPGAPLPGSGPASGTTPAPGVGSPIASGPPAATGATPPTAAALGTETLRGPEIAPPRESDESDFGGRFTIPSIVMMGVGGASLVGALVTGLVAHADYNSLERQCRGGLCPPSSEDELDEGKTLSVLSTVLTIVGVVAAGTGATLLVIGANEKSETPARSSSAVSQRSRVSTGQLRLGPGVTPLSVSGTLSF
jgi:hypothetical protein